MGWHPFDDLNDLINDVIDAVDDVFDHIENELDHVLKEIDSLCNKIAEEVTRIVKDIEECAIKLVNSIVFKPINFVIKLMPYKLEKQLLRFSGFVQRFTNQIISAGFDIIEFSDKVLREAARATLKLPVQLASIGAKVVKVVVDTNLKITREIYRVGGDGWELISDLIPDLIPKPDFSALIKLVVTVAGVLLIFKQLNKNKNEEVEYDYSYPY